MLSVTEDYQNMKKIVMQVKLKTKSREKKPQRRAHKFVFLYLESRNLYVPPVCLCSIITSSSSLL